MSGPLLNLPRYTNTNLFTPDRLLGLGLNKDEGDQVSINSEVDYETDIVEELLSELRNWAEDIDSTLTLIASS